MVAVCDRGNYPVVSFLDDAGDATAWYPSVVADREGELRFGFDAVHAGVLPGWTVVRSFKRVLSSPTVSPQTPIQVGSTTASISELIAKFLSALRRDISSRSNAPAGLLREERMRTAVATPANSHGAQRFITLDAFRRAGFDVIMMLNEPSAAGFEYAHRYRSTLTSRREHVVVYDLGGGTFDASLVRMSGQHHDVTATAGIARLGGDDFDTLLADLALGQAGMKAAELASGELSTLLEVCRGAKEALAPNSKRIVIDLETALGSRAPSKDVAVSAAAFYEACTPLVLETIDAMLLVAGKGEDGEDSGVQEDLADVAGVYVVGGASSLPVIARLLKTRFGRRVHRSQYPSAAAAIGLAIAANPDAGFRLTDRFSRTFGVFRESMDGTSIVFDPIFSRDTCIPEKAAERVVSTRTYRAAHNIGHFRYVECTAVDDQGSPRGDLTPFAEVLFAFDAAQGEDEDLKQVPVRRMDGRGPLVQEMYVLDTNGIVEVTIRNLDAGYERMHRL